MASQKNHQLQQLQQAGPRLLRQPPCAFTQRHVGGMQGHPPHWLAGRPPTHPSPVSTPRGHLPLQVAKLQAEAERLISEARAAAQKQVAEAKAVVSAECAKELAEAKAVRCGACACLCDAFAVPVGVLELSEHVEPAAAG